MTNTRYVYLFLDLINPYIIFLKPILKPRFLLFKKNNYRITDPEILEKRYPVILKKFLVNRNTGGKGKFNGGDGLIRELLFRKELILSVLTERRVFAPYGLEGGEPGKKGKNILYKNDNRPINLGSKATYTVKPGKLN